MPELPEIVVSVVIPAGTPTREIMNSLFEQASKVLQELLPRARAVGTTQKAPIGGDNEESPDARLVGARPLERETSTAAGTSPAFSHSSRRSLTIDSKGTFTEDPRPCRA